LAFAYESKGDLDTAIKLYKKAIKIDSKDTDLIIALSSVYVKNGNYVEARELLNNIILGNHNDALEQFAYIFRLLKVDVYWDNKENIKDTLYRLDVFVEENPKEINYIVVELSQYAYELIKNRQRENALSIITKGLEWNQDNGEMLILLDVVKKQMRLFSEFAYLEKDERIIAPFKHNIFLFLFCDDFSEEEYDTALKNMIDNVNNYTKYQPLETIQSLKRLSIKYPELYEIRIEFFKEIYKRSEKYLEMDIQYENLMKDNNVSHATKRLITLYLSDVTEEERKDYFQDILDEMSREQSIFVSGSIRILKKIYPALYDLNSNFFVEIMKKI